LPIVVLNPLKTDQPVEFTLDGEAEQLDAGFKLELAGGQPRMIRFSPGNGQSPVQYRLTAGIYYFQRTDATWTLRRRTFRVTIDNRSGETDFGYLADNEQAVVRAGATRDHTSRFPLVVVFDRGDGGQPAHVALATGTYRVAGDPQTGVLDLFLMPPENRANQ